ncbi:MAG: hypothetical protein QOG14_5256 [Mycobacterium sp.]|jgi:hypothetical protein|nr:hypothetical protein [Mycobacterium sp.]
MVKVGAVIRAADLDGFTHYRMPMPLQNKIEHHGGLTLTAVIDPEDTAASA